MKKEKNSENTWQNKPLYIWELGQCSMKNLDQEQLLSVLYYSNTINPNTRPLSYTQTCNWYLELQKKKFVSNIIFCS